MAVPHLGDNRPLSRKKNIAAPIIATEINQKDPPTTSCGNNNLFIHPFISLSFVFNDLFSDKSMKKYSFLIYIFFRSRLIFDFIKYKVNPQKILNSIFTRMFLRNLTTINFA
jgi:hypothetical protein